MTDGREPDRGEPTGGATPYADPEREITMVGMFNTVLRHRRMIVLLAGVFAILGVAWGVATPRTFAASASFIPQEPQTSGSSAAALARQFGIDVGGGNRPNSPQFYADVLRSSQLLRTVVEAEYEVSGDDGVRQGTLIELFEVGQGGLKRPWQKAVDRLRRGLSVGVGRETGIVSVRVGTFSPALSEQILENMLAALQEFNVSKRRSQALEKVRFVSERVRDATSALDSAEQELKVFLERNRNFQNSPELQFEHDRLQRQVMIRQELYMSLLQSLEEAQIEAVQDLPVITVIEDPDESSRPEGRGTVLRGILGLLFGGFVGIALAFVRDGLASEDRDDDLRELRRLASESWADLRRPYRVFRA